MRRRGSKLAILAGAAGVAVALAGCGASGTNEPVATTHVTMPKSYRFDPEVIAVDAGSTVTWTNEDNFTHTVRVDGQADHRVGRGESVALRFPEPGTFHYVCMLHPHDMEGEVIVR